jgi:hypothetical protein
MVDTNINQDEYINKWENNSLKSDGKLPGMLDIINPVPMSETKKDSYFLDCVFVGDSEILPLAEIVSIPYIFAGNTLTIDKLNTAQLETQHSKLSVPETVKAANKPNFYLMIGGDSISTYSSAEMTAKVREFLNNLSEDYKCKVYICSILPISPQKETETNVKNTKIDEYNSSLLKLADELGVNFLDTNIALKGVDGKLRSDITAPDGKLKREAYSELKTYILSHIRQ